MANIEITDNTIIRSLIRKGSDADRKRTTLAQGELGYTTDTNRVFIGDGITAGGSATGNKFLGVLNSFADAINLGIQPGDWIKVGTGLYARNADGTGSDNDESGYTECGFGGTVGIGLSLDSSSRINVNVDNSSIIINGNDEIALGDVPASNLPIVDSNSIIGNPTGTAAQQVSINVNDNNVLGRIAGSNIRSISFDEIIENATAPNLASARVRNLASGDTGVVYADSSGNLTRTPPPAINSKTNFQSIVGSYFIYNFSGINGGVYVTGRTRSQIKNDPSLSGKDDDSNWITVDLGTDATDTNSLLYKFLNSAGVTNFSDYSNLQINAVGVRLFNQNLIESSTNGQVYASWANGSNFGASGSYATITNYGIRSSESLGFDSFSIHRAAPDNKLNFLNHQSNVGNIDLTIILTAIYFS